MSDFLVPREQFLASPFGQALFLGKNTSFNSSRPLPLVNTTEQSYLTSLHGANLMDGLGAYWQNRTIVSGPGNITGSNETGTPAGSRLAVQLLAAPAATSANTGGLPSHPSLYSTVGDPSALQAIVTLNITSNDTLDLLLAALLDNTTGGPNAVNGTFQSVTAQVGFLGLSSAVVNAIPNAVEANDGLYGPPGSQFASPPSPAGWGAFWNAVTSVVTNPTGTVESLAGVVWTAGTAAFTYLDHLATEALALDAEMVARTAAAIGYVGQEIVGALEQLLNIFVTIAKAILSAVVAGFAAPFLNALHSWASAWNATTGYVDGYYLAQTQFQRAANLSAAENGLWSGLGALILVMLALATAFVIVTTLAGPLDIGAGLVAGIVTAVLVTAFSLSSLSGSLGIPNSLLGGTFGGGFAFFSSLAEHFFNLTESPLNSSTALAIAVPDGDPFEPWGALLGAVSPVVGLMAGAEAVYLGTKDTASFGGLAASFLAAELTFVGLGVAIYGMLVKSTLPAQHSTGAERTAYEGDAGLAAVSLGFAASGAFFGLLAIHYKASSLLNTISIFLAFGVAALSVLSIGWVYATCGAL